jgi:hypothetical protein
MSTYAAMALAAVVSESHFGKGATRQAVNKKIAATHDGCSTSALRIALKKLVTSGAVVQDGQRFKVTAAGRTTAKPKKVAAKKASTKKATVKKTTVKKTSTKKAAPKKKVPSYSFLRPRLLRPLSSQP